MGDRNKNDRYCRQIVHQHLWRKFFLSSVRGVVNHVNIFLSSRLITIQNFVAVSHTLWAHVGGPKIGGCWSPAA